MINDETQEVMDFVKSLAELDRKHQALKIQEKYSDHRKGLAFKLLDNIDDPAILESCQKGHNIIMSKTHYSFPSIEQFSTVRRQIQYKSQFKGLDEHNEPIMDRCAIMPKVKYEGTIKLHGTNAAIVFEKDGSIYCQSRENIIAPGKDNAGFAAYISTFSEGVLDIFRSNFPEGWNKVVVYGEWAGKGIQKAVAISEIEKTFFMFAARNITEDEEKEEWIDIRNWNVPISLAYNIYGFPKFEIEIDFENPGEQVNQINEWVLQVEAECPVGKVFGVSGIGEGIVWRPIEDGYYSSRYVFKTKGSEHSKSKVTKLATVDVEKSNSIREFVDKVLEEGRLEQGFNWLKENDKPQDEKGTGDFLRWIINDILKENKLEMEVSNITEKDLGKVVQLEARRWFFNRIKLA